MILGSFLRSAARHEPQKVSGVNQGMSEGGVTGPADRGARRRFLREAGARLPPVCKELRQAGEGRENGTINLPTRLATSPCTGVEQGNVEVSTGETSEVSTGETSPISVDFLLDEKERVEAAAVFTPRQLHIIQKVMTEVCRDYCGNAWDLTVPTLALAHLELRGPVTFRNAITAVIAKGDKAQARAFVGAVIDLQHDPRVVGEEILPMRPRHNRA